MKLEKVNILGSLLLTCVFLTGTGSLRAQEQDTTRNDPDSLYYHQGTARDDGEAIREDEEGIRDTQVDHQGDFYGFEDENNNAQGQNDQKDDSVKTFSEIEDTQDKIEDVTMRIYQHYENYPDFSYTYNYGENGELESVKVVGVGDRQDMQALEKDLMQLQRLRSEIENQANRIDVYYVTETLPKPKEGYEELYDELYGEMTYPEEAKDRHIEGTVYVKFLVDDEGDVLLAKADHSLNAEDYNEDLVEKMVSEAETAVESTSGEWEPARIGGVPVTQWMMIPVEFETELYPHLRPFY